MQFTTNFSLEELCRSETAKRLGIKNEPNGIQMDSMRALAENVLQPLRDKFGPIFVSSCFRSEALNKATAGSSATSQHCKGEAADIDMDGIKTNVTNAMLFDYIERFMAFDQLIWEHGTDNNPDWVHVSWSFKGPQRKMVIRTTANGGYIPFTRKPAK